MRPCALVCIRLFEHGITIRSNSVYSANGRSLLELHFQIPYLAKAEGHLSFHLHILALKSPIAIVGVYTPTIGAFRSIVRGIRIVIILSLTGCGISVSFVTMSLITAKHYPAYLLLSFGLPHPLRYNPTRLDYQTYGNMFHLVQRCQYR